MQTAPSSFFINLKPVKYRIRTKKGNLSSPVNTGGGVADPAPCSPGIGTLLAQNNY